MVVDTDGTEGVPAILEDGVWFPLMGADMARVESLRQLVEHDPAFAGMKIAIQRFGHRETIGTIDRSGETVDASAKRSTR